MLTPHIEVTPLFPALRAGTPTTLDILVAITVPQTPGQAQRPSINLGLVIDRSGSMQGDKLEHAKQAAVYAIEQLRSNDRVSVTVFDNTVQTLVANTLVEDKLSIIGQIKQITTGGSTALFDGWKEGAAQVGSHLKSGGLNRVLLLTDGQANIGESRPDFIATDVARQANAGISTSALGLGDDYNEDLLEAIGNSGDGGYYYVESPDQLQGIFEAELKGLSATFGTQVRFEFDTKPGVGKFEILNDPTTLPDGRAKLPNLIAGSTIKLGVRLQVPSLSKPSRLGQIRVTWTPPRTSETQVASTELTLPVVTAAAWDSLAPNLDVQDYFALLEIARLKREAAQAIQHGQADCASQLLCSAAIALASMRPSAGNDREKQEIAELQSDLSDADFSKLQKRGKAQAHRRQRSQ